MLFKSIQHDLFLYFPPQCMRYQSVVCVSDIFSLLSQPLIAPRFPSVRLKTICSLRRAAPTSACRGAGVRGAYTSPSSAGGLRGRRG